MVIQSADHSRRWARLRPPPRAPTLLALAAAMGLALPAAAQAPPTDDPDPAEPPPPAAPPDPAEPPPPPPEDPKLARAKELFREGMALLRAGDTQRALERFLASREAFPSAQNTTNAAISLERLGRHDEALELYEEVLTKHAASLPPDDRAALGPVMAALRQKVGRLEVSANVEGASVLVDGRRRGVLPLPGPIRVLPGRRLVRVVRSGYETFERTVEVEAGAALRVDARLEPLRATGLLRVEDPALEGAEIFVDGVAVGAVPWEGTLGPGKHVVWTRKGELGSAPTEVTVLQGQTALVRLRSGPLGPPLRIAVEPATASLALGGASLGTGGWEGRLPLGRHLLWITEPGYRTVERSLVVTRAGAGEGGSGVLRIRLAQDPSHPRWAKPAEGGFEASVFLGPALAPSLGADAELACPGSCEGSPSALGFVVGGFGGYRLGFGLAFEIGGGYLSLGSAFSRRLERSFGAGYPITYVVDDEISFRGPVGSAGVSQRLRLGARVALIGRVHVGVVVATSRDALSARIEGGGQEIPTNTAGAGEGVRAAAAFAQPELGAELAFGRFFVGLGMAARLFLLEGPVLPHGSVEPRVDACDRENNPGGAGCAPGLDLLRGERGFGSFASLAPQLGATYRF